jgi:predicted nucleic acid-binding protein
VNYFYWDASALVKRYAPEIGTSVVNHLFAHVVLDGMMCLVIGTGEVISIFVRKKNVKIITDVLFSQALVDFRASERHGRPRVAVCHGRHCSAAAGWRRRHSRHI